MSEGEKGRGTRLVFSSHSRFPRFCNDCTVSIAQFVEKLMNADDKTSPDSGLCSCTL